MSNNVFFSELRRVSFELFKHIGLFLSIIIGYEALFKNFDLKMKLSANINVFLLLLGSFLLIAFFFFAQNYLKKQSENRIRIIKFLIIIVMMVVQISVLINLLYNKAYPKTDLAVLTDSAIRMLEDYYFPLNSNMIRYPQNRFLTLLLYYFYKLLTKIGITQYWEASVILNFFSLNTSALFTYLIFKQYKNDERKTCLFLLVIALNPFMYLWFPYYYTSMLSLPFMMGAVYFIQRVKYVTKSQTKNILIGGILAAIAYRIRVTTFIVIIAFFINDIYKIKKTNFIRIIKKNAIFLISFLISVLFIQSCIGLHMRDLSKDEAIPVTHYIMMGLQGDGRYSYADVEYTTSFETKEEKINANLFEIKERINKLGISGYWRLIEKKISLTWSEGYDGYTDWYSLKYPLLAGNKSTVLLFYCQVLRVVTFFYIILFYFSLFRKIGSDSDELCIWGLTLIGGVVFYALWEANPKYSVAFNFFLMLLMTLGLMELKLDLNFKNKKVITQVFIVAISQLLVFLSIFKSSMVANETYYIYQPYRNYYIKDIREGKKKISQEFQTKQSFNKILIGTKRKDERKENLYKLTLRDETGVICSYSFGGETTKINEEYIEFNISQQNNNTGSYRLEIEGIGEGDDNLEFAIERSMLDYYPQSVLYNEGYKLNEDLTFIISNIE